MDQKGAIEIAHKYINYLKENSFDIRRAYLFGSYANGQFTEDSDIDLALVMGSLSNSFTTQVELMKIGLKFDSRIEPHPFEESDVVNPFMKKIIKTGIRVA